MVRSIPSVPSRDPATTTTTTTQKSSLVESNFIPTSLECPFLWWWVTIKGCWPSSFPVIPFIRSTNSSQRQQGSQSAVQLRLRVGGNRKCLEDMYCAAAADSQQSSDSLHYGGKRNWKHTYTQTQTRIKPIVVWGVIFPSASNFGSNLLIEFQLFRLSFWGNCVYVQWV